MFGRKTLEFMLICIGDEMRDSLFIQTSTLLFACTLLLSLTSCLDAGDESIILEEEQEDFFGGTSNYINFDGQTATYNPGNMPSATSDTDLGDVIMNTQALAGGASFITIKSSEDYDAFYVGLAGHKGYYIVEPKSKTYNNATGKYTYTMVMNFSENYNETVNVIIPGIKKETARRGSRLRRKPHWRLGHQTCFRERKRYRPSPLYSFWRTYLLW